MVDTAQEVYIDAEIGSLSDWELFVPTYITVGSGTNTQNSIQATIGYSAAITTSGVITTSYSFRDATSSLNDTPLTWTVSLALSGTITPDIVVNYGCSEATYSGTALALIDFVYGSVDYANYMFTENELVYLNTIPAFPDNTRVETRVYIGVVNKTQETITDLTLSNSKIYKDALDIICGLVDTISGTQCDIEAGPGRVGYFLCDLYNGLQAHKVLSTDLITSVSGYVFFTADVYAGPGAVGYTFVDLCAANQQITTSNLCDIRTWSLNISNFFLEEGAFCLDTATMYVDLTDSLYSIDTDNSYFLMDGIPAVVTLSGIADGYRMFYDPPDDFATKGALTVTVHTENSVGDVLEQNYYLLHGYDVQYLHRELWSPAENIFVRMAANNEVFCTNTEGDSFYFETVDLPSYSLGVSIQPVSFVNLGATIYPQSTAFFYGGVYTVRLSKIKDYRGNEMADVIFTFEIENPIN